MGPLRVSVIVLFLFVSLFPVFLGPQGYASDYRQGGNLTLIALKGPVSAPRSEISGLALHRGRIFLLPQYPERFAKKDKGIIFSIPEKRIADYISGLDPSPIEPDAVSFVLGKVDKEIPGWEGFESIVFDGDRVWLTIESKPSRYSSQMQGFVIAGAVSEDGQTLKIDPKSLTKIPPQTSIKNKSEESIFLYKEMVCAIHEANGVAVNKTPVTHCFKKDLSYAGAFPFPNLEYRVTDVTELDDGNRFYAVNYMFSGDKAALQPSINRLMDVYGKNVMRKVELSASFIIELEMTEKGVRLTDTPPISVPRDPHDAPRNWEGIVRFKDKGFLIATDTHPETMLAFLPFP